MNKPLAKIICLACLCALALLAYTALLAIPRQVLFADRLAITRSPMELGVAFENVRLSPRDRQIELAGWWMPATEPVAALVFIHGGTSNRHTSYFGALEFYRAMVDNHVSVLAIDLRNHGESGSDSRGVQFGRTEKHDALAAIEWVKQRRPDLPVYAMGISMGGATLVYAAAGGAPVDGLILMDPLLDTRSGFTRAIHAETGMPSWLFSPSAWAAVTFWGLPTGEQQALVVGEDIQVPTLLLQDPDDPVTLASHARDLAAVNPRIELWQVPAIAPDHPELRWREGWGSHVAGFVVHGDAVLSRLLSFIGLPR